MYTSTTQREADDVNIYFLLHETENQLILMYYFMRDRRGDPRRGEKKM